MLGGDGEPPDPERVEGLARSVLARAELASGAKVEDVNIFRNMASFVARGGPGFIRSVLDQPEVVSAIANRRPEDESGSARLGTGATS